MYRVVFCVILLIGIYATRAGGDVITTFNLVQWQLLVGDHSTIDFQGFPNNTPITNQFASQGVIVTGAAFISGPTPAYANDSWGLYGPIGLRFHFDSPQYSVAVHYPGSIRLNLFLDSDLVYSTSYFQPGGLGNFVGLISTISFDEVYLDKGPPTPFDVFLDDLHWGGVPAPGALALAAIAGAFTPRRRRRM